MNKTVVYVGLGLLALYLLTRKKDVLKSAEVKQTLPPPEIGQPVEKPKPPVEVTQMPVKSDFFNEALDFFKVGSIPCANNPDKFYNPNMTYIVDPCRDYARDYNEELKTDLFSGGRNKREGDLGGFVKK
jgi:hypothetical protein